MSTDRVEPRPIKRLLIANRGEIATRILSSARELGLETVALYTDNDVSHVRNATLAVRLASPAAYSSVDTLCDVVHAHAIDAVAPGFGFLSETPELAARMAAQGVLVVGPGAAALERTGDKLAARALAQQCGVPVLPALTTPTGAVEAVRAFAERNGLPVMVKAVDGGGGRGIRLVRRREELAALVRRAIEESPSRRVFAERAAVDGFRHVEVQIVGDGKGGVRHLWERECSVQRRYQKVVEVAPSGVRDRRLVAEVIEAAVRVAKEVSWDDEGAWWMRIVLTNNDVQINYASLGTFEFLVNPRTKEFFFLEINPRLQVEHTITESICSIDIVKVQLRLAQGASFEEAGLVDLSQDPLTPPKQHSIQLRVTAEDPEKNYSLSIGKITSFSFPSGVGVRVDTALVHGVPAVVSSDFDSVIAKIIVTARTWEDAVSKVRRVLEDTSITGIQTNITLLQAIVGHPDFEAGNCDTQWLESRHEELLASSRRFQNSQKDFFHGLVKQQVSGSGSPATFSGSSSGPLFRKDDAWTIDLRPAGTPTASQDSSRPHHLQLSKILRNDFPATLSADILFTVPTASQPEAYTLTLKSTAASSAALSSQHRFGSRSDPSHVILPISGKLVEVCVDVGEVVRKDEPVCVVKQMKMEIEIRAHRAGQVSWVTEAEDGEDVAEGMLAAVIEEDGREKEGRGAAKL